MQSVRRTVSVTSRQIESNQPKNRHYDLQIFYAVKEQNQNEFKNDHRETTSHNTQIRNTYFPGIRIPAILQYG